MILIMYLDLVEFNLRFKVLPSVRGGRRGRRVGGVKWKNKGY